MRLVIATLGVLLASTALAQTTSPFYDAVRGAAASPADARALSSSLAAETALLRASNAGVEDSFGFPVAISGNVAVVGASFEGGPTNETGASGAAYIFERTGSTWTETAILRASNPDAADLFGYSVSISGDVVVVGAHLDDGPTNGVTDAGAVYVFERVGAAWTETAILRASSSDANDNLGFSVSISGSTIVAGAWLEDGPANAIDASGAAYVFERTGNAWAETAILRASNAGGDDRFGSSVSASNNVTVVGSYLEDDAANTTDNAGAAYIFERAGTAWIETALLRASSTQEGDFFGSSVAVSEDVIVVGSFRDDGPTNGNQDTGAAYVFGRTGTTWAETAVLRASIPDTGRSDNFGISVSVSGSVAVIGAASADSPANGEINTGAAYVFERIGGMWSETAILHASNAGRNDEFGSSVSVSGGIAVIGAFKEDGPTNATTNAGAAYIFSDIVTVANEPAAPSGAALSPPYPNPSLGQTSLTLTVDAPQRVRAVVVDALGREVAVVLDQEVSGTTRLDVDTARLVPGVYVVRVTGATLAEARRLTVAR